MTGYDVLKLRLILLDFPTLLSAPWLLISPYTFVESVTVEPDSKDVDSLTPSPEEVFPI